MTERAAIVEFMREFAASNAWRPELRQPIADMANMIEAGFHAEASFAFRRLRREPLSLSAWLASFEPPQPAPHELEAC